MIFWKDRSNCKLYVADVWFENFTTLGNWKPISKQRTEEILVLELMCSLDH